MEEEGSNVYVGGLSASVTPEILRAAFIPFGDVVDAHIPIEPSTGQSKGFGFVVFELPEDADEAIDNMHNSIIDNQRIRVRHANKRSVVVPGRALWHSEDPDAAPVGSNDEDVEANGGEKTTNRGDGMHFGAIEK